MHSNCGKYWPSRWPGRLHQISTETYFSTCRKNKNRYYHQSCLDGSYQSYNQLSALGHQLLLNYINVYFRSHFGIHVVYVMRQNVCIIASSRRAPRHFMPIVIAVIFLNWTKCRLSSDTIYKCTVYSFLIKIQDISICLVCFINVSLCCTNMLSKQIFLLFFNSSLYFAFVNVLLPFTVTHMYTVSAQGFALIQFHAIS